MTDVTLVFAALTRFKSAHNHAVKMDTEDGLLDQRRKATGEAWLAAARAENELRDEIKKLVQ